MPCHAVPCCAKGPHAVPSSRAEQDHLLQAFPMRLGCRRMEGGGMWEYPSIPASSQRGWRWRLMEVKLEVLMVK